MAGCILQFNNARQAAQHGDKITAVSKIILSVSDPLVHSEWWFSDRHDKKSFSSTMQGDDNGCRFADITYKHGYRWTGLLLPLTDEQEDRAWEKALELDGKPYDLVGLGSFGTSWNVIKPNPDAYWCSEVDAELCKAAYGYGMDFIPHFFHPVGLFFEMYRRIHLINQDAAWKKVTT